MKNPFPAALRVCITSLALLCFAVHCGGDRDSPLFKQDGATGGNEQDAGAGAAVSGGSPSSGGATGAGGLGGSATTGGASSGGGSGDLTGGSSGMTGMGGSAGSGGTIPTGGAAGTGGTGACNLGPRQGCCFDDADCADTERCVGFTCSEGGEGICKLKNIAPACWDAADCPAAGCWCSGPQICACGLSCLAEDRPGICVCT
jgi:hypothetical protein